MFHRLPIDLLDFHPDRGKYHLSRQDLSGEARRERNRRHFEGAGVPLKIAAKVDAFDQNFLGD